MLFQPFKKATRPETPQFAQAELAEGLAKAQDKQRVNALKSQNLLGGAELYNAGMGDRTPIADYLFGPEEVAAEAAAPGVGTAAGPPSVLASTPAAAPTLGAGASTAAGESALASMGPAGWAALAGLLLMNM